MSVGKICVIDIKNIHSFRIIPFAGYCKTNILLTLDRGSDINSHLIVMITLNFLISHFNSQVTVKAESELTVLRGTGS